MSDLNQAIKDNAAGPKRAQGDAGSVEQHSLKDQIAADRYLSGKKTAKKGMKGLVRQRAIPPGSV